MNIKKQLKELQDIIKQNVEGPEHDTIEPETGKEKVGQVEEVDGIGRVFNQGGKTFLEVARVGDSPDYPATAEITQEHLDRIATSGKYYGSTTLRSVVMSSGAYSKFTKELQNEGRLPKWGLAEQMKHKGKEGW